MKTFWLPRMFRRTEASRDASVRSEVVGPGEESTAETGDLAQIVAGFCQTAENSHPAAQLALGMRFQRGDGVPQDRGLAMAWIRRAAEFGYAEAQYELGVMYYRASLWNRPLDDRNSKIEAYKWLRLASVQGFKGSAQACDLVNLGMTPEEVTAGNLAAVGFVKPPESFDGEIPGRAAFAAA